MEICSKSDIGAVRKINQDYCYVESLSENKVFAIVCDGMGGANGGSTASKAAVKFLVDKINKDSANFWSGNMKDKMLNLVKQSNTEVFKIAESDESLSGMGTTIVFAVIDGEKLHLVHAGDSRAYVISDKKITQVTKDHSIVQQLVESGEITKEQAKTHPRKNIITRAIGVYKEIALDYFDCELKKNDYILICTDGLTNYLSEDELLDIVSKLSCEDAASRLISEANSRGGRDNITVVLIKK